MSETVRWLVEYRAEGERDFRQTPFSYGFKTQEEAMHVAKQAAAINNPPLGVRVVKATRTVVWKP